MRIQYLVKQLIDQINKYVIDKVIELNYEGLKGRVRIVASDIDRSTVASIRDFTIGLLSSDEGLRKQLDLDRMLDASKFPRLKKSENKHKITKPSYEDDGSSYYDYHGKREFSFVRAQREREKARDGYTDKKSEETE